MKRAALTVRGEIDLALSSQEVVCLCTKQERVMIAALSAEEVEAWRDMPVDETVAEQRSSGGMAQSDGSRGSEGERIAGLTSL